MVPKMLDLPRRKTRQNHLQTLIVRSNHVSMGHDEEPSTSSDYDINARSCTIEAMTLFRHPRQSLCSSCILLLCGADRSYAFQVRIHGAQQAHDPYDSARRATTSLQSTNHALQRVCNKLLSGESLKDVEKLVMEVEEARFPQASAWVKAWAPMRSVIAEVPDVVAVSVLVLPRGTKLEWRRHDKADSIAKTLFGHVKVADLEIQGSDGARKLEQQELEATYKDGWAVGGSEESDCVCRGGRCPRMWDCPFWVDRRRAEAKGSSAHVALKVSEDVSSSNLWRAGRDTVRRVEALEPSAVLEIHVGPRNARYYQEIPSQVEEAVELIEVIEPLGVKPGVCRYTGPPLHLPR